MTKIKNLNNIKVAVIGAAGRMGSLVCEALINDYNDISCLPVIGEADFNANLHNSGIAPVSLVDDLQEMPDLIIDFSAIGAVAANMAYAGRHQIPIIECVTGFDDAIKAKITAISQQTCVLLASNTSHGVYAIKQALKSVLPTLDNSWCIDIIEHHHSKKVDAPSGTAVDLATIINNHGFAHDARTNPREEGTVQLHSLRAGVSFCNHDILLSNDHEQIVISHKALNKKVFATGAIKAGLWLLKTEHKNGLFTLDDVLQ